MTSLGGNTRQCVSKLNEDCLGSIASVVYSYLKIATLDLLGGSPMSEEGGYTLNEGEVITSEDLLHFGGLSGHP